MSSVAVIIFIILGIWAAAADWRQLRQAKRAARLLYVLIYALAGSLFLCRVTGIDIPMPTRIMVETIGPWVRSLGPA